MRARPPLLPLVAGLFLAACTTTPVAPIPKPLPETLAWATAPGSGESGAFLGLKTRENLAGGLDALDFPPGVHVTEVVENSPAARAGFRIGDVVLAAAGHATDDPGSLDAVVEAVAPGASLSLEVQRGDTVFEVPVRLGTRGGAEEVEPAHERMRLDPARSRAGWLTGRGGVVLVASDDGAPFPRAGVAVRSVVLAVDGEAVLSDRGLIRRLEAEEPGARVEVDYLTPDGEARTARVTLQDQDTKVTRASVPILFGYEADVEGEETSFTLVDLWLLSLFHYERHGAEREWSVLRFLRFSTGVGELAE